MSHETWVKGDDKKLALDYYGRDAYTIDGELLRELLRDAGWSVVERAPRPTR